MTSSNTGSYLNDIETASFSLIICSVTGFVYSTLLLYFLSMFAETIAWLCIVILQLGLVGGSLIAFYKRSTALTLIKTMDFGKNNHVNKYSI